MAFPPVPVYPDALDSSYTLFLVYNTTETRLCDDNNAWADQLDIVPVHADQLEIWADNGFGNIEGELFYYDAVDKNSDGKVYRLKNCARALSGQTKFNPKGTWVRGYVIAEQHNQLVNAILNTENFIGYNFDPRPVTLDWRIRHLQALQPIFDDFGCPNIDFTFNITSNSSETGVVATYLIQTTPPGFITSFRLDFGDGQFTTTTLFGTHVYSVNASIDPVLTVVNGQCQMVLTPIERSNPLQPPTVSQPIFDIPIPEIPNIPDFTVVPCTVPEPEINLPPLVTPCISIEGQIPSVTVPGPVLVSNVVISGPTNPVEILYSVVTIEGGFSLPSLIVVDVPPTIIIEPPIPPTIVVITNSNVQLGVDFTEIPKLEVDWGSPPPMEVALTMARAVRTPKTFSDDPAVKNEFGEEFADLFAASEHIKVQYEPVGIPSEIHVIAPDIKIDSSSIPKKILIEAVDLHIPESIKVYGPDSPLPHSIPIIGPEKALPEQIAVVNKDVPTTIGVEARGFPDKIIVEPTQPIPDRILVELVSPIPDRIVVDAQGIPTIIQVTGFPESIPVTGLEKGLQLLPPETMPQVEMVYRGGPVEMKLVMDKPLPGTPGDRTNCVMIVPCPA